MKLYTDGASRWHMYDQLKGRAELLVGWYARTPELVSSVYYDAMMRAIDALLPDIAETDALEESA